MDTTLTIKMDRKLRDDAKKVAEDVGIPLTTAVNALVKQFVRERRLVLDAECPFPSHTPNAETQKAIQEVREYKARKRKLKGYATTDKMFADILGATWRSRA